MATPKWQALLTKDELKHLKSVVDGSVTIAKFIEVRDWQRKVGVIYEIEPCIKCKHIEHKLRTAEVI